MEVQRELPELCEGPLGLCRSAPIVEYAGLDARDRQFSMRIVAISDLHGNLPEELPDGDLLAIGGDVCPIADHGLEFQAAWLEREFYPWLDALPHPEVVWIAGNHDFVCESENWGPAGRARYLCDSRVEVGGVTIHGTPWVPHLPRWAFHASEADLAELVAAIPPVDVLISHGPPRGSGDRLVSGARVGSEALRDRLEASPPKLCVTGHIHEDHGVRELGRTTVANVAFVDERYAVRPDAARTFDIEPS